MHNGPVEINLKYTYLDASILKNITFLHLIIFIIDKLYLIFGSNTHNGSKQVIKL